MFNVIQKEDGMQNVVRTFRTFEEARSYAVNCLNAFYFHEDEGRPGYADFFAEDYRVFCIEPA